MSKRFKILIAVLWLPIVLYVGSYFLLVRAEAIRGAMIGLPPWPRVPYYVMGGSFAENAFAPIHELDRRLRPRYWRYGDLDELVT